jgi:hypothetical protein
MSVRHEWIASIIRKFLFGIVEFFDEVLLEGIEQKLLLEKRLRTEFFTITNFSQLLAAPRPESQPLSFP